MKIITKVTVIFLIFLCFNLFGCKKHVEQAGEVTWIKIDEKKSNVASFEITRSEITVESYHQCVLKSKCKLPPKENRCTYNWPDPQRLPINCVNWHDANDFCSFINARLPTEEEWQYAATSQGKDYQYPWGNSPEPNCDYAVIDFNGRGCGRRNLWPVCSLRKGNTEQGLCDMAGNAWEWTASDFYPTEDTNNPVQKKLKVAKGGGISSDKVFTTTVRKGYEINFYYGGLSFRCVR